MCNTWEKQLAMYIGLAIGIGFFINNEYRISENGKFDIGTPLEPDIRVFGHTCLLTMLLLIGLTRFYTPGVFV